MNALPPKHFFFDVETTSADVTTAGIRQISLVDGDPQCEESKRTFNYFIIPSKKLRTQPAEVYRKNNAVKLKKVFPIMMKMIMDRLQPGQQAVLVGHNIYNWDSKVLKTNLQECQKHYIDKRSIAELVGNEENKKKYDERQHQFKLPGNIKFFDTLFLARTLKIAGSLELSELCYKVGGNELQAHDSLNDALMTQDIFNRMIEKAPAAAVLSPAANSEQNPIIKAKEIILKYRQPPVAVTATKVESVSFNVMDTETTGLETPIAILQLGGYNPATRSEFNELVNPNGIPISEGAFKVHKISEEMVANAPKFREIWNRAMQWRKANVAPNQKEVIVGHNFMLYDLARLKESSQREGFNVDYMTIIDTWMLARNLFKKEYLGGASLPPEFNKLGNLAKTLGIESFENAHDAVADCKATAFVLEKFLEGVDHADLIQVLNEHKTKNTLPIGDLIRRKGRFDPKLYVKKPAEPEKKVTKRKRKEKDIPKEPAAPNKIVKSRVIDPTKSEEVKVECLD